MNVTACGEVLLSREEWERIRLALELLRCFADQLDQEGARLADFTQDAATLVRRVERELENAGKETK